MELLCIQPLEIASRWAVYLAATASSYGQRSKCADLPELLRPVLLYSPNVIYLKKFLLKKLNFPKVNDIYIPYQTRSRTKIFSDIIFQTDPVSGKVPLQ